MNIRTNLLEENVNFVDFTQKRNKHFKLIIFLVANTIASFLFFLLFKHLKE